MHAGVPRPQLSPAPSPQAVTHLEHEGWLSGVLRPHVQAAGAWHVGRRQAAHCEEHAHLVQGLAVGGEGGRARSGACVP